MLQTQRYFLNNINKSTIYDHFSQTMMYLNPYHRNHEIEKKNVEGFESSKYVISFYWGAVEERNIFFFKPLNTLTLFYHLGNTLQ